LFSSGPGDDDEKRTREARGLGRTNQVAKGMDVSSASRARIGVLSNACTHPRRSKKAKGRTSLKPHNAHRCECPVRLCRSNRRDKRSRTENWQRRIELTGFCGRVVASALLARGWVLMHLDCCCSRCVAGSGQLNEARGMRVAPLTRRDERAALMTKATTNKKHVRLIL
jgi:hypothetical protein